MPPLSNPRHEMFAQERAKGVSASWAYVKAGFKRHDGNAARLSGNEKVAARIEEIQSIAAKKVIRKLEVSAEKTLIEAARLAFWEANKERKGAERRQAPQGVGETAGVAVCAVALGRTPSGRLGAHHL